VIGSWKAAEFSLPVFAPLVFSLLIFAPPVFALLIFAPPVFALRAFGHLTVVRPSIESRKPLKRRKSKSSEVW
jgi:hypothetical protein